MKNLIYLLYVLLFCSCLGAKKIVEQKSFKNVKHSKELTKDSTNITVKTSPISDSIITPVVSSGNAHTDRKIDEILSKLNTQKRSASSGYKQYYDNQNRELITSFSIEGSQNKIITSTRNEDTQKTDEQKTEEYIFKKVKLIPWWVYALLGFWFLPQILTRFKMFSNLFKKN